MRIVVIGATGHIGSYLAPMLVEAGHEVVAVARGARRPYVEGAAWRSVRRVSMDRAAEEAAGTFGARVASLEPDAVIDLICFEPASAQSLVDALAGRVRHFLHCGSIWVHGHATVVPTDEAAPRRPLCDYGRKKNAIEDLLMRAARTSGFPATVLHPGHIVGEGWAPINPQGHLGLWVFQKLARGEELALPNLGMETLHHVHAADVALAFVLALQNWSASVGESFHVVSPGAVTLRGYAEAAAAWFGREANVALQPWEQWRAGVTEQEAAITWDHIRHSPNCSIARARKLLGFEPRYTSLQATRQSVEWLLEQGQLTV
jgi:nucleoside-diphosphate-sugar epimerase